MKKAPACEYCNQNLSDVYCLADDAFLCITCNDAVHSAHKLAKRHEQVPTSCKFCDANLPVVYCRVDDAYLCNSCDATVHSGNGAVQMHQRVPMPLNYLTVIRKSGLVTGNEGYGSGPRDVFFHTPQSPSSPFPQTPTLQPPPHSHSHASHAPSLGQYLSNSSSNYSSFSSNSNPMLPSPSYTQSSPSPPALVPSPPSYGNSTDSASALVTTSTSASGHAKRLASTGRYTLEEREIALNRYRQKRHQRSYTKKIKYECRKVLAENRPRIKGRFARADELGARATTVVQAVSSGKPSYSSCGESDGEDNFDSSRSHGSMKMNTLFASSSRPSTATDHSTAFPWANYNHQQFSSNDQDGGFPVSNRARAEHTHYESLQWRQPS